MRNKKIIQSLNATMMAMCLQSPPTFFFIQQVQKEIDKKLQLEALKKRPKRYLDGLIRCDIPTEIRVLPVNFAQAALMKGSELDAISKWLRSGKDYDSYLKYQSDRYDKEDRPFVKRLIKLAGDFVNNLNRIANESKVPFASMVTLYNAMLIDRESFASKQMNEAGEQTSLEESPETNWFNFYYGKNKLDKLTGNNFTVKDQNILELLDIYNNVNPPAEMPDRFNTDEFIIKSSNDELNITDWMRGACLHENSINTIFKSNDFETAEFINQFKYLNIPERIPEKKRQKFIINISNKIFNLLTESIWVIAIISCLVYSNSKYFLTILRDIKDKLDTINDDFTIINGIFIDIKKNIYIDTDNLIECHNIKLAREYDEIKQKYENIKKEYIIIYREYKDIRIKIKKWLTQFSCFTYTDENISNLKSKEDIEFYISRYFLVSEYFIQRFYKFIYNKLLYYSKWLSGIIDKPLHFARDGQSVLSRRMSKDHIEFYENEIIDYISRDNQGEYCFDTLGGSSARTAFDEDEYDMNAQYADEVNYDSFKNHQTPKTINYDKEDELKQVGITAFLYETFYKILSKKLQRNPFNKYILTGEPEMVIKYFSRILKNAGNELLGIYYNNKVKEEFNRSSRTIKRWKKEIRNGKIQIQNQKLANSFFEISDLNQTEIEAIIENKKLKQKHQKDGYLNQKQLIRSLINDDYIDKLKKDRIYLEKIGVTRLKQILSKLKSNNSIPFEKEKNAVFYNGKDFKKIAQKISEFIITQKKSNKSL